MKMGKNRIFHELAWFKTHEPLKPMPKWYHASKLSLFVGFPTILVILILLLPLVKGGDAPPLMKAFVIFLALFTWVLMIAFFFDNSSYFNWVDKYKNDYLELKASYPSYSERDFYLKVKASLVKEWEKDKQEQRECVLKRSIRVKEKYDL